jgi:hypothetical protein
MPQIEFKLEGFSEFEDQLKALAEGYRADLVARNTLVKAAKRAMQPAYDMAQSLAALGPPNSHGIHMKQTMRIDSRIPNNKDKDSIYTKDDDIVIAVLSVKRSAVSLAYEFGTADRAARPLLRASLLAKTPEIIENLRIELNEIIPKYWKSLRRRGIK